MRPTLYLIAAGLFQQPDRAMLERLRNMVATLLRETHCESPWRSPLVTLSAQPFPCGEELTAEYNRLFVLGTPGVAAQPFASCWLEQEGRLMGSTTLAVREMMAAHGLQADGGLLPDHIVSELEFMAWLADREGDASASATRSQLLRGHLARWVPQFTAALRKARPSARFAAAADFLDRLIAWDLGCFDPDIPCHCEYPLSQGVT